MDGTGVSGLLVVVLAILRWGFPISSLAIVADVLARPGWHFGGRSMLRGRLAWLAPQVVFLVVVALGFVSPQTTVFDRVAMIAIPPLVAADLAYLLRVVYPSGERAADRACRARTQGSGAEHAGLVSELAASEE